MTATPVTPSAAGPSLTVLAVLKTSVGAAWFVQQAETVLGRGHRLVVVLPDVDGPLARQLLARGAEVIGGPAALRARPWQLLRDLVRLRRVLGRTRPDVLFYQLFSSAVMARLASLGTGVRRVHMVPGPLFLEAPHTRLAERILCRLDDVVLAGSAYTAQLYRELGLPHRRVLVAPYGVDVERLQPATPARRQEARRRLGLGHDEFVAVMVAYVYGGKRAVQGGRPIKGHDTLLRAWRLHQQGAGGGRLLLVGGGFDAAGRKHRDELVCAHDLARDRSVVWSDSVDDVSLWYAAADVSVAPSLSENHGSALEASAFGVPTIASAVGGLPEVVDESTGWIVPAGDPVALAAALAAAEAAPREVLSQMGRRARRRVERRFALAACTARVVTALESPARAGR